MQKFFFILFLFCLFSLVCFSQKGKDTNIVVSKKIIDTSKNKFNPRKATIRSAILPGWGQVYNKKYWKLPLVYGALGTTAGIFAYNVKNYKRLKSAYINKTDGNDANNGEIYKNFQNLSAESIRSYRNEFRQNVDYSVLFFVIFWGLNVADATVDAHLKSFDVNDDLSLDIKPGYSPLANTAGVSLVLNIGK